MSSNREVKAIIDELKEILLESIRILKGQKQAKKARRENARKVLQ